MRKRIGRPSTPQLIIAAVLVIGLVVGLIVPGGTGDTIEACAGAALAFVLIARFGIFHQPTAARRYPPGDEREREPTEYGPPRPGGSAGGLR
jgi:hypothetical protein